MNVDKKESLDTRLDALENLVGTLDGMIKENERLIRTAIDEAVKAERRACAKIADDVSLKDGLDYQTSAQIAELIRRRK